MKILTTILILIAAGATALLALTLGLPVIIFGTTSRYLMHKSNQFMEML